MPGSAFIQHIVNNGTARSDDPEAEEEPRRQRVVSTIVTREQKE